MYVHARKDPVRQWLPTSYRLTTEDVSLIVNECEEEWKRPTEKTRQSKEEEEQDKNDEEQGDEQGKDKMNGASGMPDTSTVLEAGLKWKDKGKEQEGGGCKKAKAHRHTPFYILTNDYMDRIGY